MNDARTELKHFLRLHPKVGLVDAQRPVSESHLRWIQNTGGRITMILDGRPMAAIVPLEDLQLLEAADASEPLE